MTHFKSMALAIILFAAASCSKDETVPEIPPTIIQKKYYPISIGSYWIYDDYNINNAGIITSQWVDSMVTKGTQSFNGKAYTTFKTFDLSVVDTGRASYLRKSDSIYYALYYRGNPSTNNFQEEIALKDNLVVGATWSTIVTYPNGSMTDTVKKVYTVTAVGVAAIVNGSTYSDVLKIAYTSDRVYNNLASVASGEIWYADNVGPIYQRGKIASVTAELKLKRYKIK